MSNRQDPVRTDGRNERGERRREQIVAAAMEMFAVDGYRGTGLTALAERIGITHSGLLHHFGTKENLLLAVVERREQEDRVVLGSILGDGGIAALERLPLLAQHIKRRAGLAQLQAVLVHENLTEGPAHPFFVDRYRRVRAAVAETLRDGQARGELIASADPQAVATRILATLDGLHTQWFLDPDQIDLEQAVQEMTDSLVRELRVRPGQ